MPFIQLTHENSGTIELYYEDHGAGKPVVLIHGFPLSSAAWEKQVPALLKAGRRTINYDRRGFGKSSQPALGYDYETFAADLNILLVKLDLRDVTLVGHSMGTGEISRYLAIYGSDRVEKAVFISPLPPFLLKTADHPEGLDKRVFEGFQQSVVKDRFAYLKTFLTAFYSRGVLRGNGVSDSAFQASWNLGAGASPIGTRECIATWMTDFRPDLPFIDVPSLIIHGNDDHILPFNLTAKPLHAFLKDSRLVEIEGGSHGILWTHAEEINREILDFIGAPATGDTFEFESFAA